MAVGKGDDVWRPVRRAGGPGSGGAARVVASTDVGGAPLAGVLSRALLEAASDGEPLLLHRGGRLAAVLVNPETFAELEVAATELLAQGA